MDDPKWFYLFFASIPVVEAVSRIPYLRNILKSSLYRHLGRISYALYLVHGPILWTLGSYVYEFSGKIGSSGGWPLGLEPGFLLAHVLFMPVTFCIASETTRGIDELTISVSHNLYS
jgi:peptidoglycan/LPS O-acetylase OafA/YrhL